MSPLSNRPSSPARRRVAPARPNGLIVWLSDFGSRDAYAGIMKGVALSVYPRLRAVDLTHDIPPQAVAVGAQVLRSAVPYFPAGTVYCAVVDPGVGSARRAVAVHTERAILVGPDNGLLAPAALLLGPRAVHAIENRALCRPAVSRTFHGRDVFAPVAAHLARGTPLARVGPALRGLQPLALPEAVIGADGVRGEVIYVDRFGNLLTNIEATTLDNFRPADLFVRVADMAVAPVRSTYAEVEPDALVAVVSSWGGVEVAVRNGDAATRLGAGVGTPVTVYSG